MVRRHIARSARKQQAQRPGGDQHATSGPKLPIIDARSKWLLSRLTRSGAQNGHILEPGNDGESAVPQSASVWWWRRRALAGPSRRQPREADLHKVVPILHEYVDLGDFPVHEDTGVFVPEKINRSGPPSAIICDVDLLLSDEVAKAAELPRHVNGTGFLSVLPSFTDAPRHYQFLHADVIVSLRRQRRRRRSQSTVQHVHHRSHGGWVVWPELRFMRGSATAAAATRTTTTDTNRKCLAAWHDDPDVTEYMTKSSRKWFERMQNQRRRADAWISLHRRKPPKRATKRQTEWDGVGTVPNWRKTSPPPIEVHREHRERNYPWKEHWDMFVSEAQSYRRRRVADAGI